MAITDSERHRLHTKLDQVLGEEDAAVLISHLPPSGWSDVARTRDLDQLELRIDARFEAVDHRFEAVDRRFDAVDHRFDAMEARFDAVDARFDAIDKRFQMVDVQFEKHESKFEAALERNLRLQTTRFFIGMGALVTFATAVQAGISQALGG